MNQAYRDSVLKTENLLFIFIKIENATFPALQARG